MLTRFVKLSKYLGLFAAILLVLSLLLVSFHHDHRQYDSFQTKASCAACAAQQLLQSGDTVSRFILTLPTLLTFVSVQPEIISVAARFIPSVQDRAPPQQTVHFI
ncbi:MAG: hypothetical protein PHD54_04810 [Desulfuromonadaceae bacterium]|nr:hypothetical protein [Desulfuromonadaceae bacterium]